MSGSRRVLKRHIDRLLVSEDSARLVEALRDIPPGQAVAPLLSRLCTADGRLRQRAVIALGAVVTALAREDAGAAREVVRRLMWSLNDESGSIGWGAPEAMAEIIRNAPGLGGDYVSILVSYMREDGNYLEHVPLQRGLLQGLGRLGEARPHLLAGTGAADLLPAYLRSGDPVVRGLAAWCCGLLHAREARAPLGDLESDTTEIELFRGGKWVRATVGALADEALRTVRGPGGA